MAPRLVFIGAGSIGFTRKLVGDLLAVPELRNADLVFMDIDPVNLERVERLVRRDIEANGLDGAILSATTDRRQALENADYVFSTVRIGGLEAFETDIDIPVTYGVDQCVGDTLSAGGIMYGQRNIPFILDLCRDIRELAKPDCLFLNYANPMAMNVWAAHHYGGVRVVGLCHGVQHGHQQIAKVLGVEYDDLQIVCAGINHQTWYVKLVHNGEDHTGRLLEAFERSPMAEREKVRVDMLRRFGYYSTESNGHLSEYLPWYRKNDDRIHEWIADSSWAGGETGGYLRVCQEWRHYFDTEYESRLKRKPLVYSAENRSLEHGSFIVESLETGRTYRGHFNMANRGCIPNLPEDAIVEAPGLVDATGLRLLSVGELPMGPAAVCNASISVQRLSVEAAVNGDDQLLRQAMMMDPLVGAVCTPPEVWQMVDEMLVAQEKWLPQYATAIAEARKRLAAGRTIPTKETNGAARKRVRSAEEMAEVEAKRNRPDEG